MINRNFSQKGSAHIVIVVILVTALLGTLGFVFWQNNGKEHSSTHENDSSTTYTYGENEAEETPVLVDEDLYSFTVAQGFKESSEQQFTHSASLKAVKTFVNDTGDYFEVLTADGDGGGIGADYFWSYSVQNDRILVEKSARCAGDLVGCTYANNSVEGIISDIDKESNYYLAFGNQHNNAIDMGFVDAFTSTFRFNR